MSTWVSRKLLNKIWDAYTATDRSTYVFYVTSNGGEGKTVLLRQLGMRLDSPGGTQPGLPWSGILDLYDSELNTPEGISKRLSDAFESSGEFRSFRDLLEAVTLKEEAGVVGPDLEQERAELAKTFAECFNLVTSWTRCVVAIDTMERVQFEADNVQRRYDIRDESTAVFRAWLVDQLRHWENCVIVLVGRPETDPYLGKALSKELTASNRIQYFHETLGGFDDDEVRDYFELRAKEYPAVVGLDSEFRQRLWIAVERSPIRLDLAMEVIQNGIGFSELYDEVMGSKPEFVGPRIDDLLIKHLMKEEPRRSTREILRYLAVARKGIDADLLHFLAGDVWSIEECQLRLDEISQRHFVKRRPFDQRVFLHDELYLFCDRYLLSVIDAQRLSQRFAEWYDLKLAEIDEERAKSSRRDTGTALEKNQKERERTRRYRDLQVDSLWYRLRANPKKGYHWYFEQDEYAIRSAEVGLDMRLHNEMLAFLESTSPIDLHLRETVPGLPNEFDCDSASRWIKRLLVVGNYEEAEVVAGKMNEDRMCTSEAPSYGTALADLQVFTAQTLMYLGKTAEAIELLEDVISDLRDYPNISDLAERESSAFRNWRRNLVMGRAHNNLGYAYWVNLGAYSEAVAEFREAISQFRSSNLREEMANTEDNLGRVYALLRHQTKAETFVANGLRIRKDLGRDYRTALSQNSKAIVHLEFDQPHRALQFSQRALDKFQELGSRRGWGLGLTTLGRSYRGLGNLSEEYSTQECDRFFGDSLRSLETAVDIFKNQVAEPVRLIEAINELGCTYRDRAILAKRDGAEKVASNAFQQALRVLEEGVTQAYNHKFTFLYVDSAEDLAQTYLWLRDWDNARLWLDRAEGMIPVAYKIPRVNIDEQEKHRIDVYWSLMGKIELSRGNLEYDSGAFIEKRPWPNRRTLDTATRHYMLSSHYFAEYSAEAHRLKDAYMQIHSRFQHCPDEEIRYIANDLIPEIAKDLDINVRRPSKFLEDTLGHAVGLGSVNSRV